MKKYVVTFRNKKSGAIKYEVTVDYSEDKVTAAPMGLCLAALDQLQASRQRIPKTRNTTWGYKELQPENSL